MKKPLKISEIYCDAGPSKKEMIASVQVVHDEKMLAIGADSVTASNSCCPI